MTQLGPQAGDVEVGTRLERDWTLTKSGTAREVSHGLAYEFVVGTLVAATLGMFAIMIWGVFA